MKMRNAIIKKILCFVLGFVMAMTIIPPHTVLAHSNAPREMHTIQYGEHMLITNTTNQRIQVRRHQAGVHFEYVRYNADGTIDSFGVDGSYTTNLQAGQSMVVSVQGGATSTNRRVSFYTQPETTITSHPTPALRYVRIEPGESMVFTNSSNSRLSIRRHSGDSRYYTERLESNGMTRTRRGTRNSFAIDAGVSVGVSVPAGRNAATFRVPYSYVSLRRGTLRELLGVARDTRGVGAILYDAILTGGPDVVMFLMDGFFSLVQLSANEMNDFIGTLQVERNSLCPYTDMFTLLGDLGTGSMGHEIGGALPDFTPEVVTQGIIDWLLDVFESHVNANIRRGADMLLGILR